MHSCPIGKILTTSPCAPWPRHWQAICQVGADDGFRGGSAGRAHLRDASLCQRERGASSAGYVRKRRATCSTQIAQLSVPETGAQGDTDLQDANSPKVCGRADMSTLCLQAVCQKSRSPCVSKEAAAHSERAATQPVSGTGPAGGELVPHQAGCTEGWSSKRWLPTFFLLHSSLFDSEQWNPNLKALLAMHAAPPGHSRTSPRAFPLNARCIDHSR